MEVRRGSLTDLAWVREQAQQASQDSPYRQGDARRAVRERLAGLEVARLSPHLKLLIAVQGDQRRGFVLLNLDGLEDATGEVQAELQELVADDDEALRALVTEAARLAARKGLGHLAWRVPAWDIGILQRARSAGFEVERCEILMHCSPQGPVKSLLPDPGYAAVVQNSPPLEAEGLGEREGPV